MSIRIFLIGSSALIAAHGLSHAANIDRATITEVLNSVSLIEPATKRTNPARAQQIFTAPNVLRTGPDSRAEMVASDQTVTRVGQNTLFSFEPNSREINLQRGSILFNSPSGNGGGTIRTPAASAAVLGTTMIVVTTKNGGFKALLIEGKGRMKGADGSVRKLNAGEMVYALPGGKLSSVFEFRLSQQVGASNLIRGFKSKLPSAGKIAQAINRQEREIGSGTATPTNLLAGATPTSAYQVDVARTAQIEAEDGAGAMPLTPFQTAISTDAVVTSSTPDSLRVFGPGLPEQSEFPPGTLPFLVGTPGSGKVFAPSVNPAQFFGGTILFATPAVDLANFAAHDVFQFAAINDILFDGTTEFGSFPGQLQLIAGGTFQTTPGSVIAADTPQFVLLAFGSEFPRDGFLTDPKSAFDSALPLTFSDIEIRNREGSLQVLGGDIELNGVRLSSGDITHVVAGRDLKVDRAEDPVSQFTIPGDVQPPAGSNILTGERGVILKAGRDIFVREAGIASPKIAIEGRSNIRMQRVQITDLSDGRTLSPGGTAGPPVQVPPTTLIMADNLVDLNRVNFSSRDVLVQSRTIALTNVQFHGQSRVLLESAQGRLAPQPNTGRPAIPGMVNFISNVRYGDGGAASAVIQNGAGTTPSGPGIVIRPRRN